MIKDIFMTRRKSRNANTTLNCPVCITAKPFSVSARIDVEYAQ